MTTDYVNVEPQEKQTMIQKAINALSSNWVGVESMMKNAPVLIVNLVGLLVYGLMMSTLDYLIVLVLLLMTVLNFSLTLYARTYEERHKKEYAENERQITYLYDNSVSLINGKDVRIYQMEDWFYQVFNSLIKTRVKRNQRVEIRYLLPTLSDNILLLVRDIIAYGILVEKVFTGDIDAATFTLLIGIIGGFTTWLTQAVNAYAELNRANMSVIDFRKYEEIEEAFHHGEGCSLPTLSEYPLSIEFKDVSFRYPGAETDTITHLNLKIDGGSKLALVGMNGAGKTSLVKLLSGLYYPTEGEILVGGKPVKEYNAKVYQRLIGAVFQDVEILAFSIAKNVAACREDKIDYKRVRDCLALAGLKEKIEGLKDGENTYLTQEISKDGILLSGGEMQKLMLARALYKDAPIMLLDEPTSALDPIAESELYEKYNDLTKDKTSIFISHRLSSTMFCDRILYLEQGQIVEDGTHQELMKRKGKYAKIYEIQSHYYKESRKEEGYEAEAASF
jgi:ABC-type bacteriocin/lantibiotic exporter with double-glycine peptidase domain